ncbi:MAG: PAS domain S-box protein [Rhizomicrobium sp.]
MTKPRSVAHRDVQRLLVEAALVFAAYYIAGRLGQATTHIRSSNLGPVWPAYGVALAAVLRCGYRIWPTLLVATFIVALQSPIPPITAAGQAISSTLATMAGGYFLRKASFDLSISRLRDALNLIVRGGLASAMISATLGVAVLYATGHQAYEGIASAWLVYWLGDATGVLLITPLALTGARLFAIRRVTPMAEFVALLSFLIAVCLVIFGDIPLIPVRLHVLAFTVLPFVIWAAIQFGVSGVSLVTLVVATAATVATALGSGPFALNDSFTDAVLLDVFFAVLAVSGLTLAAVIAERERAEADREELIRKQAAVEARLRLAAIVESSDDAIVGQDVNGIVTDWNEGAERLYGYSAQEAVGNTFRALVRPDLNGAAPRPPADAIVRRETTHRKKDGKELEVAVTRSPVHDVSGSVVGTSVIAHDISERQRAAAALRESQGKLRLILDSAAEGIFGVDLENRCTFCNPACARLLGYEHEDHLLGQDMYRLIHHSRADGTPLPLSECKTAEVYQTGEPVHVTGEVLWKADGTSFPADWWAAPQKRGEEIIGLVIGFTDVTERKQAEEKLRRVQAELTRLTRVTILGELASSVAHEIKQPLTAISANAEASLAVLGMDNPDLDMVEGAVVDILRDGRRAGDVIQRIQQLVTKRGTQKGPLDLNDVIHSVMPLLQSEMLRHRAALRLRLGSSLPVVLGDRVQLQQVILNLVMNGIEAMSSVHDRKRDLVVRSERVDEDWALVAVEDAGPGLEGEDSDRLFDAFFTTKPEGTGIGLSISRSIIEGHCGRLWASRNPHHGATFQFKLPAMASQMANDDLVA